MDIQKINANYYLQIKENKNFYLTQAIKPHIVRNKFSFVAVKKNKILGYIYAEEIQNVNSILLYALEVIPEERNKGIGKSLVKYLEGQCKTNGIKSIFLFYYESDHLNSFYKSLNFEGIETNMKTIIKEL